VDVVVSVTERPSGSFSVGLGFSQVQGLIATLALQQDNFLGSGKSVGLQLSRSDILTQIGINYNNPYWLDSGVSRGFSISYSEFNPGDANISLFSTDQFSAGVNFGFPISEVDFINAGLSYSTTDVNIGQFVQETFNDDGSCFQDINNNGICGEQLLSATRPLAASLDANGDTVLSADERQIDGYTGVVGWSRDTSDSFLFPTRGSRQSFSAEATGPGSTRDYYKLFYRYAKFWPIYKSAVLSVRGNVGYGDSFDNFDDNRPVEETEPQIVAGGCQLSDVVTLDSGLPFYEHFFAGGVRDIRGYDDNTLGPKDQFCRAVGGDFKVSGGVEIGLPVPFGGGGSKISLFMDAGNVYRDIGSFESSELRGAAGVSITWQAPVGPVVISYAFPIKDEPGDITESLQFSFGTVF